MARTVPQGLLTWDAATSEDVVNYRVYYSSTGEPTYDSPFRDIGLSTEVDLPLEGQEPMEGNITYGISAIDSVGNESDIVTLKIVIDTTPPAPPTNPAHKR